MPKVKLKTKENKFSVKDFLNRIETDKKRKQSFQLLELFLEVTGEEGTMWGSSIIGFGKYTYKYSTGRQADWLATGFSPRKQNLTIYIMPGYNLYNLAKDKLQKLGPHKLGKSCLYIKDLDEIDKSVLKDLVAWGLQELAKNYPIVLDGKMLYTDDKKTESIITKIS